MPTLMPEHPTPANQDARQRRQREAEAVRALTTDSQDYYRLPGHLRAIVEAHHYLEAAVSVLDSQPVESRLEYAELLSLVWHTEAELVRHGIIEKALPWLAEHPQGWED